MLVRMRGAAAVLAFVLFANAAVAQQKTNPFLSTSTRESGTIATGGTFQQVFAAATSAAPRNGCLIQNTGSAMQYVFVGPIASATEATSYQIQPPNASGTPPTQGGAFSCATLTGGVVQDQISIAGNSSDTFTATSQP